MKNAIRNALHLLNVVIFALINVENARRMDIMVVVKKNANEILSVVICANKYVLNIAHHVKSKNVKLLVLIHNVLWSVQNFASFAKNNALINASIHNAQDLVLNPAINHFAMNLVKLCLKSADIHASVFVEKFVLKFVGCANLKTQFLKHFLEKNQMKMPDLLRLIVDTFLKYLDLINTWSWIKMIEQYSIKSAQTAVSQLWK